MGIGDAVMSSDSVVSFYCGLFPQVSHCFNLKNPYIPVVPGLTLEFCFCCAELRLTYGHRECIFSRVVRLSLYLTDVYVWRIEVKFVKSVLRNVGKFTEAVHTTLKSASQSLLLLKFTGVVVLGLPSAQRQREHDGANCVRDTVVRNDRIL
jgi:hypothetical protein